MVSTIIWKYDFKYGFVDFPVLIGKNYDMWLIKIEMMLKARDVWEHVRVGLLEPKDDEEERVSTNAYREWLRINKKKNAYELQLIQ